MSEASRSDEVVAELERRLSVCLDTNELIVDFYRIGYRYSFQLPLRERPEQFPAGVLGGDRRYPWLIWIGWELEERWRVLARAARASVPAHRLTAAQMHSADDLLNNDLSALRGWSSFDADYRGAGLFTSSLSAVCADVIEQSELHAADTSHSARAVAHRILDETVTAWFTETWADVDPFNPSPDLSTVTLFQNIRCITLFRATRLASAIGHGLADELQSKAFAVYTAWLAARAEPEPMTEGVAYDGFLLEAVLEWLGAREDALELREEGRPVLSEIPGAWIRNTAPGRSDLLAPVGDVEPEMMQWSSVLLRLALWYDRANEVADWFATFPVARLLASSLGDAHELACVAEEQAIPGARTLDPEPVARADRGNPEQAIVAQPGVWNLQPATATVRTGHAAENIAVVVAASRTPAPHLHLDGGHITLGWQQRWWITDPGYQQYRRGEERDFTIGSLAHNVPVIDGVHQSRRAVDVQVEHHDSTNVITLDLTACYQGLPPSARFTRQAWLRDDVLIVVDRFAGLAAGAAVDTHWHADSGLAWSFVEGAARLSDGQHALWMVTGKDDAGPGRWDPGTLQRHTGTRGPLRLDHHSTIQQPRALRWWAFIPDDDGGWHRPANRLSQLTKGLIR